MKSLSALTESEVLALAIANEEEDSRIYQTFAEKLRKTFPASATRVRRDGGGRAHASLDPL